jgi:DNA-binding GntR family transcriptional regulator
VHLKPLARKPLADEVYSVLRGMIIRRELPPGARVTEIEIAERLGVSRTPVREAFQRLSYDELLNDEPGRSPQVSAITVQRIEEAYPLIAVLEGLAIRLACRRLTEADLRHMEDLTQQMALHGRRGETELLMQADGKFHGMLHERAENDRLHRVVIDLRARLERLEYIFFSTPEAVAASVQRHRRLVRVLRRRDPRAAQKALERQWETGQQAVRSLVERLALVSPEAAGAEAESPATLAAASAAGAAGDRFRSAVRPTSQRGVSKTIRIGGV